MPYIQWKENNLKEVIHFLKARPTNYVTHYLDAYGSLIMWRHVK